MDNISSPVPASASVSSPSSLSTNKVVPSDNDDPNHNSSSSIYRSGIGTALSNKITPIINDNIHNDNTNNNAQVQSLISTKSNTHGLYDISDSDDDDDDKDNDAIITTIDRKPLTLTENTNMSKPSQVSYTTTTNISSSLYDLSDSDDDDDVAITKIDRKALDNNKVYDRPSFLDSGSVVDSSSTSAPKVSQPPSISAVAMSNGLYNLSDSDDDDDDDNDDNDKDQVASTIQISNKAMTDANIYDRASFLNSAPVVIDTAKPSQVSSIPASAVSTGLHDVPDSDDDDGDKDQVASIIQVNSSDRPTDANIYDRPSFLDSGPVVDSSSTSATSAPKVSQPPSISAVAMSNGLYNLSDSDDDDDDDDNDDNDKDQVASTIQISNKAAMTDANIYDRASFLNSAPVVIDTAKPSQVSSISASAISTGLYDLSDSDDDDGDKDQVASIIQVDSNDHNSNNMYDVDTTQLHEVSNDKEHTIDIMDSSPPVPLGNDDNDISPDINDSIVIDIQEESNMWKHSSDIESSRRLDSEYRSETLIDDHTVTKSPVDSRDIDDDIESNRRLDSEYRDASLVNTFDDDHMTTLSPDNSRIDDIHSKVKLDSSLIDFSDGDQAIESSQGNDSKVLTKKEKLRRLRSIKKKKEFTRILNECKGLQEQGDYTRLEPLLRFIVSYHRKIRGDEHIKTHSAMHNLGNLLTILGKHNEAEEIFSNCIEYAVSKYGYGHHDTMNLMDALANSYYCQAKYNDAEKCYRENLHLRKIHTENIGSSALGNASQLNGHAPSSISTIITMNNLASVLTYIDKNDEAEELYKDTLKLRRQELGDSHYQTIISMINLGVHYYNQDNLQKAEDMYLECLAICQQHHNNTKYHHNIQYNLALLHLKKENYSKSSELLKQLCDNSNNNTDSSTRQKYMKLYTYSNNMLK